MKYVKFLSVLLVTGVIWSCSSVKVLEAWSSIDAKTVKTKNVLVIARTAHKPIRIAFENAIVKELLKHKINATESFKKYPEIDPDRKLTTEDITYIKNEFRKAGFNAVVVSVLKDVKEIYKSEVNGGYTAGESLASYYNIPNFGFYGYFSHDVAYSNFEGVDVEKTITVQTAKNYVVESLIYNLDLDENKQLVATITSEIEQPENIPDKANEYAKAIYKGLKNY